MAKEQGAPVRKVVIDAGAAIKLQRLERFGGSLYTTSGVLGEVRDEHARALLRTLPEEIHVREPLPHDIAFAKQFAKATGDLGFLSQNDLRLIALTVSLQREAGGALRERPEALATGEGHVAFDWAPNRAACASAKQRESSGEANGSTATGESDLCDRVQADLNVSAATSQPDCAEVPVGTSEVEEAPTEKEQVETEDVDGSGSDEDGDSAGEWVTPDNMHRFGLEVKPADELKVTCVTADYSVQNVLMQMGITPITFDGYAVRSVKLWGLICRACFHFTRNTEKVFCPKCGHDTVVRVPIVVDQDGKPTVLDNGRPLRRKGTVYSIPKAQGGRGWKPLFAEDEVRMGGRDRELRHAQKLSEKERQAKDPFNEDNGARAWWQRTSSNGGKSMRGDGGPRMQAGYGRRANPNANNFKGFGRKKR
mmetsp:Transcript_87215/g.244736  ORF Transcript_87215/g.244736 Transcript_87215/m.244736 type:complete len:423 (-) Transcript_87215:97-1365(-)